MNNYLYNRVGLALGLDEEETEQMHDQGIFTFGDYIVDVFTNGNFSHGLKLMLEIDCDPGQLNNYLVMEDKYDQLHIKMHFTPNFWIDLSNEFVQRFHQKAQVQVQN